MYATLKILFIPTWLNSVDHVYKALFFASKRRWYNVNLNHLKNCFKVGLFWRDNRNSTSNPVVVAIFHGRTWLCIVGESSCHFCYKKTIFQTFALCSSVQCEFNIALSFFCVLLRFFSLALEKFSKLTADR